MRRSRALAGIAHGFGDRIDGVSVGIFANANTGLANGDDPAAVRENRRRFARKVGSEPERLCSLKQVHGAAALIVSVPEQGAREGDALVSGTPGLVLAVTTADCVPVLLADPVAGVVAAVHAGWRGAVAGVVPATVAAMAALGAEPSRLVAALGPCIRQHNYEVDPPLRDAVLAATPEAAPLFADGRRPGRWQFDLPGYVAQALECAGAKHVDDVGLDTVEGKSIYFSHRRAKQRNEVGYGLQMSGIVVPG